MDASTGVSLSFEVSGRIVDFPFVHSRGKHVEAGTVLARLDDRDYSNKVVNAEAELDYAAMAVTVMCGLAFATLLTMVVIPVNYAIFFRLPDPN